MCVCARMPCSHTAACQCYPADTALHVCAQPNALRVSRRLGAAMGAARGGWALRWEQTQRCGAAALGARPSRSRRGEATYHRVQDAMVESSKCQDARRQTRPWPDANRRLAGGMPGTRAWNGGHGNGCKARGRRTPHGGGSRRGLSRSHTGSDRPSLRAWSPVTNRHTT